MDKKFILPIALIMGAAVLAFFVLLGPGPEPAATVVSEDLSLEEDPSYSSLDGDAGFGGGTGSVASAGSQGSAGLPSATGVSVATPSAPPEVILERIDDAIVSYSPEGVGRIAPYLSSRDADVREAAIEGLMQLGEPSGAELLRKAARSASNPRERRQLLEAAAFIDLPPVELEILEP